MLVRMSAEQLAVRRFDWHRALEWTMTVLSLVFIVLLIVQYTVELSRPWERRIDVAQLVIWGAFAIDFFVRLAVAPSKLAFLRHKWISAVALALPAFRVLRVLQLARAAPSLSASGLVVGGKRGGETLRRMVGAQPAIFMGILSLFVTALSSAGMLYIEHDAAGTNIANIGDALWWTIATLTTIGSELYPVTAEGRILATFVMVFGLGFAGYITGTFAVLLLGPQQGNSEPSPPAPGPDAAVLDEIRALRRQLDALTPATPNGAVAALSAESTGESTAHPALRAPNS
jgi:voltage-gated potassium channel